MPSLKSRLKKLVYKGELSEKDLNRIVIIPNRATNGNMMKTLFPKIKKEKYTDWRTVEILGLDDDKISTEFFEDWWNAPYKKGEQDNA